jgi:2,3-bisphosphoglycerate-independent phosphoglycerate mutase
MWPARSTATDGTVLTEKHTTLPITVRIVESRKVSAHIEAPQMRASEIADLLEQVARCDVRRADVPVCVQGVRDGVCDIFANFANADMVAHAMTDIARFPAVVEGISTLDDALGRVVRTALAADYVVFVTGDHGNAEEMLGAGGKANPSHTTNKVPFVVLGLDAAERAGLSLRADTTIGDLAPCAMQLRGMPPSAAWDRQSAFVGGAIKPAAQRRYTCMRALRRA